MSTDPFEAAKAKGQVAIAKKFRPRVDLAVGETLPPSEVLDVDIRETQFGELTTVKLKAAGRVRCKQGAGDEAEPVHAEPGDEIDLRISGLMLEALWHEDPAEVGDRITLRREHDSPPSRPGYSGAKNVLYVRIPAGFGAPQVDGDGGGASSDEDTPPY
jgi:hypothetical protein